MRLVSSQDIPGDTGGQALAFSITGEHEGAIILLNLLRGYMDPLVPGDNQVNISCEHMFVMVLYWYEARCLEVNRKC